MMIAIICLCVISIILNFALVMDMHIKHNNLVNAFGEFVIYVSAHIDNWRIHKGGQQ
jgi:hypothetical protein